MLISDWFVSVRWPPREEAAKSCASRLTRFTDSIQRVDNRLEHWYLTARQKKAALRPVPKGLELEHYLRSSCMQHREVSPRIEIAALGFTLAIWTGEINSSSTALVMRCGIFSPRLSNTCSLSPSGHFEISRQQLINIVYSAVDCWEPESVIVASETFLNRYLARYGRPPQIGWITYLSFPTTEIPHLPFLEIKTVGQGMLLLFPDEAFTSSDNYDGVAHEVQRGLQRVGAIKQQ
jgi:hypothetical protein